MAADGDQSRREVKRRVCLILAALVFLFPLGALDDAGEKAALAARGKYLTLKIAVVGPGDEVYLWWGHIGLVVEDALSGRSDFYDWGVFSFDNDNFYANFAFGRLLYSCAVSPAAANLAYGIASNRDIVLYTLNLPPEVRAEILQFAENNALPQNKDYWYHHFKDNCATRLRDIIDQATGGAFKARYGEAPGRFTLRGHVRRHTWFSPPWDWLFSFLMGRGIDRPITVWEEMFLPSEVERRISDFTYAGPDGVERPLVSSVEVMNTARGRHPVLDSPPRQWPQTLAAGLLLAALLGLFKAMSRKKDLFGGGIARAGRILFGLSQSLLGLFFGAAGFLLFFMSFFTNHDYTWHNSTIIFVNPLLFAAFPLGIVLAFGKPRKRAAGEPERARFSGVFLQVLWTCVFLGGLFAMALNLIPGLYQDNWSVVTLLLPPAFALSRAPGWAAGWFSRPPPSRPKT
ncbi:MAG: DUF4105 domain-containing protein [Treponema sp.]|jgi:hypothetical protein|nr:DUF4105 domain-containing protein [Treponema sp.]